MPSTFSECFHLIPGARSADRQLTICSAERPQDDPEDELEQHSACNPQDDALVANGITSWIPRQSRISCKRARMIAKHQGRRWTELISNGRPARSTKQKETDVCLGGGGGGRGTGVEWDGVTEIHGKHTCAAFQSTLKFMNVCITRKAVLFRGNFAYILLPASVRFSVCAETLASRCTANVLFHVLLPF